MFRIAAAALAIAFAIAILPPYLKTDANAGQQFAQAQKKQKNDKKNVSTGKYKNPMKQ